MTGSTEQRAKKKDQREKDYGLIIGGNLYRCSFATSHRAIQMLDKGNHRGDIVLKLDILDLHGKKAILYTRADCIQGVIE